MENILAENTPFAPLAARPQMTDSAMLTISASRFLSSSAVSMTPSVTGIR